VEPRQHLAALPGIRRELFVSVLGVGREARHPELLLLRLDLADEDRELAEMRARCAGPGIALHPPDGRGLHARPLDDGSGSIPGNVDRAAKKKVIHKNTASRYKKRIAALLKK